MPFSRRNFLKGGLITAGSATLASLQPSQPAADGQMTPLFPAHAPLGRGVGLHPGRVVWAHDPAAVFWDGCDYWWRPEHFSEPAILRMMRAGIARLTGQADAAAGWNALFRWHDAGRGRECGYRAGRKIAIKVNMNGAGAYADDAQGRTQESYINPVLLVCLLHSLTVDGGISPADITVYDAGRIIPGYLHDLCASGPRAGVRFRHRDPLGPLDAAADLAAPLRWSRDIAGEISHLPRCVTEADYLINLASLKGHCYGITLCAKNHFGSFVNNNRLRAPQAAGLHPHVASPRMGDYAVLTDLMAHRHLGGKTVLYLLDGLLTAPGESVDVTRAGALWRQPPFNGHFSASLLFSQDPVAIDSVGADFLVNEPVMREYNAVLRRNRGMENYLHEAALIAAPPSGTAYHDGFGRRVDNLGVHEHWNTVEEKAYSRNRGEAEGIELVRV